MDESEYTDSLLGSWGKCCTTMPPDAKGSISEKVMIECW